MIGICYLFLQIRYMAFGACHEIPGADIFRISLKQDIKRWSAYYVEI